MFTVALEEHEGNKGNNTGRAPGLDLNTGWHRFVYIS